MKKNKVANLFAGHDKIKIIFLKIYFETNETN